MRRRRGCVGLHTVLDMHVRNAAYYSQVCSPSLQFFPPINNITCGCKYLAPLILVTGITYKPPHPPLNFQGSCCCSSFRHSMSLSLPVLLDVELYICKYVDIYITCIMYMCMCSVVHLKHTHSHILSSNCKYFPGIEYLSILIFIFQSRSKRV